MLLIFCYLDDLFILRFVYYNFKQQQQQSQQVSLKLKRQEKNGVFRDKIGVCCSNRILFRNLEILATKNTIELVVKNWT